MFSEPYLPQNEICAKCKKRIGDHDSYRLWDCLCQLSWGINALKRHADPKPTKGDKS